MSGLGEFMVLSCIDTVEVILSDWRDTKKSEKVASAAAGYVLDHYRHKSFNILRTAHKDHHQFCRHLKIVKDWKKSCHKDKSSDRRESDDAEELGSLKMGR